MAEVPVKETIILRRTFDNPEGDWVKAEKMCREINSQAKLVEDRIKSLVEEDMKLRNLILQAYKMTPKIDCLFYDSPVAPSRQTMYVKMTLKKFGWDGVRDTFSNLMLFEGIAREIKDGTRWLLKFKPE